MSELIKLTWTRCSVIQHEYEKLLKGVFCKKKKKNSLQKEKKVVLKMALKSTRAACYKYTYIATAIQEVFIETSSPNHNPSKKFRTST